MRPGGGDGPPGSEVKGGHGGYGPAGPRLCPLWREARPFPCENAGHRPPLSQSHGDSCAWDFAWPWGMEAERLARP